MRKERKHYTAEEKVVILRRHLLTRECDDFVGHNRGCSSRRLPDRLRLRSDNSSNLAHKTLLDRADGTHFMGLFTAGLMLIFFLFILLIVAITTKQRST
jgi:hypothetical protein